MGLPPGPKRKDKKMKNKAFTLIELLIVVAIIAILAAIAVPNFLEAQVRAKVARTQSDLRTLTVALESYFVDNNVYTRDSDCVLDATSVRQIAVQNTSIAYTDLANGYIQLTTPISYITSMLIDPFAPKGGTDMKQVAGSGLAGLGYRIGSGTWSYGANTVMGDKNGQGTATDASGWPLRHVDAAEYTDVQNSILAYQEMGKKPCYMVMGVGPRGARTRMGYKCFPFMGIDNAEIPNAIAVQAVQPSIAAMATSYPNGDGQPCGYVTYDPTNGTTSIGNIYRFGGSWTSGRFVLDGKVIGSQDSLKTQTGGLVLSVWNSAP